MSSFSTDLSNSSKDFLRVVWPVIQPRLGGGELIPVEGATKESLKAKLDQASGIDAWHYSIEGQIRGIASRVQWGKAWDSFTIRYKRDSGTKTEYEKRKEAIEGTRGWLFPFLTVQAYLSGTPGEGELIKVGIAKTADLIKACDKVIAGTKSKNAGIRKTTNAHFVFLGWDWLKSEGFRVDVIESCR